MALQSHTAEIAVIIADKSPAMRRTLCKLVKARGEGRLVPREASTIHAVIVLLRRAAPALIVAGEEIGGGDLPLLVGAVRDAGYDGRLVLTRSTPAHAAADLPPGAARGVDLVARREAAAFLAELLESDETARLLAGPDDTADAREADGIVPFRVEERRIIESAIRRFGGNIGKAARALEISPSTIYRKIQTWHVDASA